MSEQTYRLLAAGGSVYLEDTRIKDASGAYVDLGDTSRNADLAVIGNRTFVCAGKGIYWIERQLVGSEQCAFRLDLPDKPGDATATITPLSSNEINALTNPTTEISIAAVSGYHIVGSSWDSEGWATDGFGVPTPRLNTSGTTLSGEGWYYEVGSGNELDWSGLTALYLSVMGNFSGVKLAFVFGEDPVDTLKPAWGGHAIPFSKEGPEPVTAKIPLASVSPSFRNAVAWYGIQVIASNVDFSVNVKGLRSQSGTTGKRDYALTLRRTDTIGGISERFRSLENLNLMEVDAGSEGANVTITFAAPVPAGHVMEVWRRDDEVAGQYHLVGTAPASATDFVDGVNDVSSGLTLLLGRSPIPTGRALMFSHGARLCLYDGQYVWVSAVGDPTTWRDMTPEEYIDLQGAGTTVGVMDGAKFLVSDAGDIAAAASMGITTADAYSTETLLMSSDGWDVLLTGVEIPELSVARRQPGGCHSRQAWTRLPDGRIAKVEPGGGFTAVNEHLQREEFSRDMLDPLVYFVQGQHPSFAAWDHRTRRAVLLNMVKDANTGYVMAVPSGKWTAWEPSGMLDIVTAVGGYWADGVWYTVFGTRDGRLYELFRGDAAEAFSWRGPDWNTGIDAWHPTRLRTRGNEAVPDSVNVAVLVDGAAQGSAGANASRRLPHKTGRVVSVQVEGGNGGALHRVDVEMARRGR